MSDEAKKPIDRLLSEIAAATGGNDWETVRKLSEQVLSLDPENAPATSSLKMSKQLLQIQPDEARELPSLRTDEKQSEEEKVCETHPTSFVSERYAVRKFLGEGARKKVYMAHDSVLDRDVAFALIKTEGLDEDAKKRVVREAQIMGKLGAYNHIVTIYDFGKHEECTYVVMELMGGGDLADAISGAPGSRIAIEKVIEIAGSICRGLEYAHARGIIHRDLKPSNMWLTAEGTVKIGDFGLALTLDRSRITKENVIVGTVTYLSPEQATGAEVTARSDLYALGAMLYEMVTGRPPFLGDSDLGIISQHINTPPVAPSWHNASCPKPLEALILRLLAKSPDERPESAADVMAALLAVDLTVAREAPPEGERQSLDSLAGGLFVGRRKEMDRLKASLEDVLSGRGRMVMIVGEPGIGKTRTAEELRTYAGLRNAQVLWGKCYEGQGAPAFWPWVQVIRSYARERDAEKLRSEMGSGAPVIAELVSDIRERFPDIPHPAFLNDPESSRFRLFDAVTTFLKSASKSQALVIVLDDLHWADAPSLIFLEFVAHELSGARILIVGAYRDVELRRQHPLQKSLGDLTRERLFERVLLRGLTKEDVARFIELAAGIKPPSELVNAVNTHTEGNPLFVTEVVRLLVQQGDLSPEKLSERKRWSLGIPEGVREVIGRRLDHLSARCNEVLAVASVIGRDFITTLLSRIVEDISEDRLIEVLEDALSARVVEELPDTLGHYHFTHRLIQETLIEELTITRRVKLHARIAEALEELYGDEAEKHAAKLASHFAQAETVLGTEKLVRYSLLAGEQALSHYAYEEANEHFQRGLAAREGQPTDAEAAELEFGLGRAMQNTFTHLCRAFEYFEKTGDVKRVAAVAACFDVPHSSKTGPLLDRALQLVAPDTLEAGHILCQIGIFKSYYEGDVKGAEETLRKALKIAQDKENAVLERRAMLCWAGLEMGQRHEKETIEKLSRVFELARIVDDPLTEIWSHYHAVSILEQFGKSD